MRVMASRWSVITAYRELYAHHPKAVVCDKVPYRLL